MAPPEWRIDKIIPKRGLGLLFGASGSYKSFVAIDWALSICAGTSWLDHEIAEPGAVVYVAAEGGPGIAKRVDAWLVTHKGDPLERWRVLPHNVDLRNSNSVTELAVALRELVDTLDEPIAMVVVDTWSRNMPGANENSAEHTSAAVGKLDELVHEFDCLMLIVHHTGLEGNRERGSTSLPGAIDTRWQTKSEPGSKQAVLHNPKQKDWDQTDDIPITLHKVGDDDSGSLVVRAGIALNPCAGHDDVTKALDGSGALPQAKLETLLSGRRDARRERMRDAAECTRCPVSMWEGPRNAVMFGRSDQGTVPL